MSKIAYIAYPVLHGAFADFYELKFFKLDGYPKKGDLVIFTGGEDISPQIYNPEAKLPLSKRDKIEIECLEYCLDNGIKMFGSCRGLQLITAYLGSKLVYDIYEKGFFKHHYNHPLIFLQDNSVIKQFFEKSKVVSAHHQGILFKKNNIILPGGLKVTSYYDGIVESVESDQIIATQFHPEWMDEGFEFFNFLYNWAKEV